MLLLTAVGEKKRSGRWIGGVRQATLIAKAKTDVYLARQLSEAERRLSCECISQRACIQDLGIYSIA